MTSGHFPAPKKKAITRKLTSIPKPISNGHKEEEIEVEKEIKETNQDLLGNIHSEDDSEILKDFDDLDIPDGAIDSDDNEDNDDDSDDSPNSEVLSDLNAVSTTSVTDGGPSIMDMLSSGGNAGDASSDIVKELLSKENLLMKTDLPSPAIPYVSQVLSLAIKYDAKNLLNRMWMYLQLRVSVDRQGRKEVVAAALRVRGNREDDDF